MTRDEVEQAFIFHPPSGSADPEARIRAHESIRAHGQVLALELHDKLPGCAETTLAIRKIQEAVMWANAALAIHGS